jgi:hypothetical protein
MVLSAGRSRLIASLGSVYSGVLVGLLVDNDTVRIGNWEATGEPTDATLILKLYKLLLEK